MAEITAALVKQLRDTSGAGMMDCKKALTESDGDIEKASDWLRKKGLAAAQKKSGRVAAEGLVAIHKAGTTAAMVEINAETDFVARNDAFQAFVGSIAEIALAQNGDADKIVKAAHPSGKSVEEALTSIISTIGENMSFRRATALSVNQGVVAGYIHSALQPNMGKIGVLIALESSADTGKLEELGHQLAMHVAAAKPEFLDVLSVDQKAIERERDILTEQAKASGKPEEIIGKMVEGRLRKYYEEVVLTEQIFVIDGETRIGKLLEQKGKEFGEDVKIIDFKVFKLGEGIEKKEEDFAAEVTAAIGQ